MNSDIIEEIVKWRMGSAYDSPILDWRDSHMNFDAPGMLRAARAGGVTMNRDGFQVHCPPGREPYKPSEQQRLVQAAEDMFEICHERGQVLSAFAAMNDARLFPSIEYFGPLTEAKCVQISFARTVSTDWRPRTEIVLWPLSDQIRSWRMPSFSPAPWDKRRPEILWRGQTSGLRYALAEDARPVLIGMRQEAPWINGWLLDEATNSEEIFWAGFANYQRLLAVAKCRDMPGADVRFVPLWDRDRRSIDSAARYLGPQIFAERVDQAAHLSHRQQNKYVLTLAGNDYPSSLRTDLLSGCLVLMPRPFWECTWFYGLKPNVHYIPLRADLADLEEKLQWCRDNDGACKEMAEAARAFALEYFEPSLERAVQARMVERLAHMTTLGNSA